MITTPKHYQVDPIFQGFPFALDEIQNFYNSGQFAAAAFMLTLVPGFNPYDTTKHYILTGCVDDGAGNVSAGWLCMGGIIAQTAGGSYTTAPGLTLVVSNPESILWSDGQSRNSVFQHGVAVANYAGAADVLLTDFERLSTDTNMVLAANWTEVVAPVNRGGVKIRLFRDAVGIAGAISWTGATNSYVNQKICDLPAWAIPPNGWGGIVRNLLGTETFNLNITVAGELRVSGELANGDIVCLDGIRWTV